MNYAMGCGFNVDEMAINFQKKKLKMKPEQYKKYVGPHKAYMINHIFVDSLKMILEDVINNDVNFKLPVSPKKCEIRMIKFEGDKFMEARKNGKFKDIDYLQSMFTGYQLGLFIYEDTHTRIKPIHVDNKVKKQLVDKVNSGHTYA